MVEQHFGDVYVAFECSNVKWRCFLGVNVVYGSLVFTKSPVSLLPRSAKARSRRSTLFRSRYCRISTSFENTAR